MLIERSFGYNSFKITGREKRCQGIFPESAERDSPTTRNGRNDGNLIPGLQGRLDPLEETDVLFVDIDVDESTNALPVAETFFQPVIASFEVLDQFSNGPPVHVNLRLPVPVDKGMRYYQEDLGFFVSEYALYPDGTTFGAWLHRKQTTHDVALVHGPGTLIHHTAFYVPDVASVVRTADILADAGMRDRIEFGPGRHGITNAFFLYFRDPADNRLEVFSGDYLIPDPDFVPRRWTHEEFEATGRLLWGARPPQTMYEGQAVADWAAPPLPD